MGILIFGISLIVCGGIALGVLIREPGGLLSNGSKICFTIAISIFMAFGFLMVMHNDIVFNKHIKIYKNGNYIKETLYNAKGNEIDVKYKIM